MAKPSPFQVAWEFLGWVQRVYDGADPIEALHGHVCSPECWHHTCGPLCPHHGEEYLAAMRRDYKERGWNRAYFEGATEDHPYHRGPGPYWPEQPPEPSDV